MTKSMPWIALCLVLGACGPGDGMVIAHSGGSPGGGQGAQGGAAAGEQDIVGGSGGAQAGGAQAGGAQAGMQALAGAGGAGDANGAAAGVGGAGASAAAGAGGQAGFFAPPAVCTDDDAPSFAAGSLPRDHTTRATATGVNGAFEDRCDAQGNLIEQVCETTFACPGGGSEPGGACAPVELPTGFVAERRVDCLGLCEGGACSVPCPSVGDVVRVEPDLTSGRYTILPPQGPFAFACMQRACSAGDLSAPLAITAFDGPRDDCLGPLPFTFGPLTLSDGCTYSDCSAQLREAP